MADGNREHSLLIVHKDRGLAEMLRSLLDDPRRTVLLAADSTTARQLVALARPALVIVDEESISGDPLDFIAQCNAIEAPAPKVVLTGSASVARAVELMRGGAFSYLTVPFDQKQLLSAVDEALADAPGLDAGPQRATRSTADDLRSTMGPSEAVARLCSDVERVAASDFTVLVGGETGSGKEIIARRIHDLSPRARGPFIPVDCGAISESLLESELFGHEKGSFTGATRRKAGKFEVARGGTLFLDEIGNLSPGAQSKLLRVLQEKCVYRVGGNDPVKVDVRLVAATNENLELAMSEGTFRHDLFFRLNEFSINIPPLRRRREDIPFLAKKFLDTTNQELNKSVRGFSESAIESLLAYDWPGNVRQFQATIRRAVLLADDLITEKHLDLKRASVPGLAFTPRVQGAPWQGLTLKEIVQRSTEAVEREVLKAVLRIAGGNKAKAARMLSIDYKTMHTKLKRYNITVDAIVPGESGQLPDLSEISSSVWR